MCCTKHWLKCLHERFTSSEWSSTLCGCPFFDLLFLALFLSAVCFFYPSSSTWTLTFTLSSMRSTSGQKTIGTPPNEESGPLAENTPLTVSVVFTIRFIVFSVHLTRIFVSSVILLSAFFLRTSILFFRTSNGKPFFVCLYRFELWWIFRV